MKRHAQGVKEEEKAAPQTTLGKGIARALREHSPLAEVIKVLEGRPAKETGGSSDAYN